MGTATIRLDEDLLKQARQLRINVSQAARDGIRAAIQRRRVLENVATLAKLAVTPKEPSSTTIRRLRDG